MTCPNPPVFAHRRTCGAEMQSTVPRSILSTGNAHRRLDIPLTLQGVNIRTNLIYVMKMGGSNRIVYAAYFHGHTIHALL
jgi:hypothetical protein